MECILLSTEKEELLNENDYSKRSLRADAPISYLMIPLNILGLHSVPAPGNPLPEMPFP
jgi:hypothetical protein